MNEQERWGCRCPPALGVPFAEGLDSRGGASPASTFCAAPHETTITFSAVKRQEEANQSNAPHHLQVSLPFYHLHKGLMFHGRNNDARHLLEALFKIQMLSSDCRYLHQDKGFTLARSSR